MDVRRFNGRIASNATQSISPSPSRLCRSTRLPPLRLLHACALLPLPCLVPVPPSPCQLPTLIQPPSPSDPRPSPSPILLASLSVSLLTSTKRTSIHPTPHPLASSQPSALRRHHLSLPRLHLPTSVVFAPELQKSRPGSVRLHLVLRASGSLPLHAPVVDTARLTPVAPSFATTPAATVNRQRTIPGLKDGTISRHIPACGYNSSSPLFRCIAFIFRAHVLPLASRLSSRAFLLEPSPLEPTSRQATYSPI